MNNHTIYVLMRNSLFECSWYPSRLPANLDISTWWFSYHGEPAMKYEQQPLFKTPSREVVVRKPILYSLKYPLSVEIWVNRTIYHLGNL